MRRWGAGVRAWRAGRQGRWWWRGPRGGRGDWCTACESFGPGGCTAFRSHSNSNVPTHPARGQARSGRGSGAGGGEEPGQGGGGGAWLRRLWRGRRHLCRRRDGGIGRAGVSWDLGPSCPLPILPQPSLRLSPRSLCVILRNLRQILARALEGARCLEPGGSPVRVAISIARC